MAHKKAGGSSRNGRDSNLIKVEARKLDELIDAVGELVIGGVGLARYLDPDKDAEKYAPMPSLGWERAYRSGDLETLRSAAGAALQHDPQHAAAQALLGLMGRIAVLAHDLLNELQLAAGLVALVDQLAAAQDRAWYAENKARWEAGLRDPLGALLAGLAEEFLASGF